MANTLESKIKQLPLKRQTAVAAKSTVLIKEELTLRQLREARKLTQESMAESLGIDQDSISRLEQRSDLLLSTLRSYVKAMGGDLQLVVEFSDRPAMRLTSLIGLSETASLRVSKTRPRRTKVEQIEG